MRAHFGDLARLKLFLLAESCHSRTPPYRVGLIVLVVGTNLFSFPP